MSSGAPNSPDSRGEAIRDWERETEQGQQLGRQFSGERLKGIAKGDWLTKVAFVGTLAADMIGNPPSGSAADAVKFRFVPSEPD